MLHWTLTENITTKNIYIKVFQTDFHVKARFVKFVSGSSFCLFDYYCI